MRMDLLDPAEQYQEFMLQLYDIGLLAEEPDFGTGCAVWD
jgi:hypothetical protein